MSYKSQPKGITIIVAASENNVLGKNNNLIWRIPEDLIRFKKLTTGHSVIMGRKTFESMPKALPKRRNIIITRNKKYFAENAEICYSIEEALSLVKNDPQPFIIGGGQIYLQSMDLANLIELTRIHQDFDGDTFFPEIPSNKWELISEEKISALNSEDLSYSYLTYKRKK
jgi:dihydrofolate reductase|tara:strand:- start:1727 stop:2236 length:510 start_codon:yes stop_codon:yes gene_type:complete